MLEENGTAIQAKPRRSALVGFFISPDPPRLRAGWRIIIHAILYNLFMVCLSVPYAFVAALDKRTVYDLWISQIISLFAVTCSVILARRLMDRRSMTSLGLKLSPKMLRDLLVGFFIAGMMMALVLGLEIALGWLKIDHFVWDTISVPPQSNNMPIPSGFQAVLMIVGSAMIWFLFFVLVGWNEEVLFRGYRLANISDGINPLWGVVLSSLWFGAAHWLNPGASWISSLGIFLAGLFLAFGYLQTKQLWLPIGLHIGWNFFEGVVFGFPVSGLETYAFIHTSISGPTIFTGGAFGPEAGLILLPAILIGTVLVYGYSLLMK